MARAKTKSKGVEAVRADLSIRIQNFDIVLNARINHTAHFPEYAVSFDDRDPVHTFTARIAILGTFLAPKDRAGHRFELTIYGDDAPSRGLATTLAEIQARDEYRTPKYRKYRGREVPIYNAPKGMGILDKIRGEQCWTGWLFASTRFTSDVVSLLGIKTPLFVAIEEQKYGRTRWIRDLSIQMSDPETG